MASSGMSEELFDVKSKLIEDLEEKFHNRLRQFTSDVKTTMRVAPRQVAMEIFEFALVFLTQAFPDVSGLEGSSLKREDTAASILNDKFEKMAQQLTELKTEMRDEMTEMRDEKTEMRDEISKRVEEVEAKVSEELSTSLKELKIGQDVKENLKKLETTTKSNTQGINGLRKLLQLLKSNFETSMAATTASAASNQGPISAAASPPKPIQSLRQRLSFSVKCSNDTKTPGIFDLKLLPCGLMVLADYWNSCLKIFNTQGQHINTLTLNGKPWSLAVLDLTSSCGWDVAVTLYEKCQVALVHVTTSCAVVKKTIQTSRKYIAIAAVGTDTLAVGYWKEDGIDLIDLSGQVIRKLNSDVRPDHMNVSLDGHLLVSSFNNEIVKIKLLSGSVEYRHKLQELQIPTGITCPQQDASLIAADQDTRTLHLINPVGGWVRQVWGHPDGEDEEDCLWSVSLLIDACVCSTRYGSVFVLDVDY